MANKKARVRLVDTTFRDAQQSLLGGNLRSDEIIPIAAKMDKIGFAAMEAFGGATFETQLRQHEDPWEFLRKLRKVTPNTPIQALIRGQNLVSKRNFADDVVQLFVKHAAKCGVDVFRVFDPLNDLRNMEAAIGAALKAKKKVQGALSYAISPAHNIELWGSLAKGLADMGCEEIVDRKRKQNKRKKKKKAGAASAPPPPPPPTKKGGGGGVGEKWFSPTWAARRS